ncbi:MAG: hypothetical protein QM758_27270 [Armatimonas sp.]
MALAQERIGDTAAARSSLEQTLALDPGYTQAREALINLGGSVAAPRPLSNSDVATPSPDLAYYPEEPVDTGRVFLSIVLAVIAGVVGIGIWIAIIVLANINLSLLGIGVGFLIGLAAVKGYGREGKTPATIAVVVASLFIGGFCLLYLLLSLLEGGRSGLGSAWSVIFNVLCAFWGIQQAKRTASPS